MSELIPRIKELSDSDKLLLLHALVTQLIEDNGLVALNAQSVESPQGLHDSFEAVAVLAQALEQEAIKVEETVVTHG
ncbi:MAG: hypothetical protein AB4042_07335 [Leptolyngbyaceae cyanobacterium]